MFAWPKLFLLALLCRWRTWRRCLWRRPPGPRRPPVRSRRSGWCSATRTTRGNCSSARSSSRNSRIASTPVGTRWSMPRRRLLLRVNNPINIRIVSLLLLLLLCGEITAGLLFLWVQLLECERITGEGEILLASSFVMWFRSVRSEQQRMTMNTLMTLEGRRRWWKGMKGGD